MPPARDSSVIVQRAPDGDLTTVAVPDAGVNLTTVERALIVFALESEAGNRTRAARFLRLTRSALLYRMHKHHLDDDQRQLDDGSQSL